MALQKKYDAVAAIPPDKPGGRTSYPRVGTLFVDSTDGRLVLKLDTLPIQGSNWQGWINFFPARAPKAEVPDDDEPF